MLRRAEAVPQKGKMPVPEKLMFTCTRASGAGKHSGCDPDVLAAWKASVIVYVTEIRCFMQET